jgi:hypothetical protein
MNEGTPGEEPKATSTGSVSIERLRAEYPRFSWKVYLIWVLVLTASYVALIQSNANRRPADDGIALFAIAPFSAAIGALFYYGGYVALRQAMYRRMLRRINVAKIEARTENLQHELEQDFFTNLVKINFKYIDRYYLQTQIQADKSFLMSAISAFVGLATIVAGIVLMYVGKTDPAYVSTAAGVISEAIAAVFFYLYNRTIVKMSDYHQKLVLTQNISLALRITQDLPDTERVQTQVALVERLTTDINKYLITGGRPV